MRQSRFIAALGVAICLVTGAKADFATSESWFATLSVDERLSLQGDLVILGMYDRLIDGEFGPGTFGALTSYQSANGLRASGVLSEAELEDLHKGAAEVADVLGVEVVEEVRSNSVLLVPRKLLIEESETEGGKRFQATDGTLLLETDRVSQARASFEGLYMRAREQRLDRKVLYYTFSSDQFVVSGHESGQRFYLLYKRAGTESLGFRLSWAPSSEKTGTMLAALLASYFAPLEVYRAAGNNDPAPQPEPSSVPSGNPGSEGTERVERIGNSFFVFEDEPEVIVLHGEITSGTPLEFLRALKARPRAKLLLLNSQGGLIDPALVIAHSVRERGLGTVVPEESECLSSCSFIYFAGRTRQTGGALGVHQVWNEANDLVSGQSKLSDVLEALTEFGVHQEIISIMLRTPPQEMHVFSKAEIARYAIDAGNPESLLSESESTDSGSAARNEQAETLASIPTDSEDVDGAFVAALQAALDNYQLAINFAAAGDHLSAETYRHNSVASMSALCRGQGYPDIPSCIGQELPAIPSN